MRVLSGSQGANGPSRSARLNLTFLSVVTGLCAAHRMRERRQPAAGACREPASGNDHQTGAWRESIPVDSAVAVGEPRAGGNGARLPDWRWRLLGNDALPRMFENDVALATAIDVRTLVFTAALTTITALVFGVGHALRATRVGAMPWLKDTARAGGQRALVARTLIGVQIAASLVLLVVAGLFVRTLHNYSLVDVGFDVCNLLVFQIDPRSSAGGAGGASEVYERVVGAIEAVPGVRSVTLSAMPVVARSQWSETVQAERTGAPQEVHVQSVRWNFFETLGMPLVAGRGLQVTDVGGAPRVAVINAAMARQVFGEAAPIGRQFAFVNGPERNVPIQAGRRCTRRQ